MNIKQGSAAFLAGSVQVVLVAIFSLLAAEIALRIYDHYEPQYIFVDDSYNRFRGRPFADDWNFRLNSLGFKDVESTRSSDRRYRILGIGDSFAFGVVPYEDNYLTLLEDWLQREHGRVEVLNMGIPATGPNEYYALLLREGLALHPDMVLLSFFIGNDFQDSGRRSPQRSWYSRLCVVSLLRYLLMLRPVHEGTVVHGKGVYCDDCPVYKPATYLKIERDRSSIYREGNRAFGTQLGKAVDALQKIRQLCMRHGIELVVVMIPDEVQVNPELQLQVRRQLADREGSWNTTLPNEQLAAKLDGLGVDYLDLYPAFATAARERSLYRPRDSHWNIAGNRLAATLIGIHISHYPEAWGR